MIELDFDDKELQKLLKKAVKENPQRVQNELDRAGLIVETGAKNRTIVDTGRLRSSIHTKTQGQVSDEGKLQGGSSYTYSDNAGSSYDGTLDVNPKPLEVYVGTNVVYAYKIHSKGGVRSNARLGGNGKGFLFNALEAHKPVFSKRLKEVFGEIK